MILEQQLFNTKIILTPSKSPDFILLAQGLKKIGFDNVQRLTDSSQIIPFCTQVWPALLLLDLDIPDMDGFDVVEKLKTIEGEFPLPIITFSSKLNHMEKLRLLSLGVRDCLDKPFEQLDAFLLILLIENTLREQFFLPCEIGGE